MVMEADQEVMTRLSSFKGKRTKRQRPVSPLGLPAISSAGESGTVTGDSRIMSTPTTSVDNVSVIGGGDKLEEEDMANCLMLLARGSREVINREFSPTTVRAKPPTSESGVYRCKTCNRGFPSFQALGGHRASHKKPNNKLDNEGNKIKPERLKEEYHDQQNGRFLDNPMSTTLSLQISNNTMMNASKANYSNKIHECSVCGAEFSSGQALGGHMRRHRATTTAAAALPAALIAPAISLASSSSRIDQPEFQESKQPRNSLQLDLNLPAETEEENLVKESNKFHFPTKEQVLVFSANSLVDCHY